MLQLPPTFIELGSGVETVILFPLSNYGVACARISVLPPYEIGSSSALSVVVSVLAIDGGAGGWRGWFQRASVGTVTPAWRGRKTRGVCKGQCRGLINVVRLMD